MTFTALLTLAQLQPSRQLRSVNYGGFVRNVVVGDPELGLCLFKADSTPPQTVPMNLLKNIVFVTTLAG